MVELPGKDHSLTSYLTGRQREAASQAKEKKGEETPFRDFRVLFTGSLSNAVSMFKIQHRYILNPRSKERSKDVSLSVNVIGSRPCS